MGKKIVFCLPGSHFSREFLQKWSDAVSALSRQGYEIQASFAYDPNIFYSRTKCLACDTRRGRDQLPFDGKVDYDYLFWIDSDVLFEPDQIVRLLNHDVDIVSGCYIMHNNQNYPIVETMDDAFFLQHGHYDFWSRQDLENRQKLGGLIDVAYVGFGFICIKKGVFEKLKYPFFSPRKIRFGDTEIEEWASEDVSWCLNVRDLGYRVLIDPQVVVAHQKLIPLR